MGLSKFREKYEKELDRSMVRTSERLKLQMEKLHSGHFVFDWITDGGYARGRITELSSDEGVGKTTCMIEVAAQEQRLIKEGKRKGGIVFFDYEHKLSLAYCQRIGLDTEDEDTFLLLQPNLGHKESEQRIIELHKMWEKDPSDPPVSLILVDSLAAMRPTAEMQSGNVFEDGVWKIKGAHASACAEWFSTCAPLLAEMNVTTIIANQKRQEFSISGGKFQRAGSEKGVDSKATARGLKTTGGKAPKHYYATRVNLVIDQFEEKEIFLAHRGESDKVRTKQRVMAWCHKNQAGEAQRKDYFWIAWNVGFDSNTSFLEKAENFGVVERAGGWYSLKIGETEWKEQGRDKFFSLLKQDEEAMMTIKKEVLKKYAALTIEELTGVIVEKDGPSDADLLKAIRELDEQTEIEKKSESDDGDVVAGSNE